ncbi:hypothetical protein ATPR_1846 [Acetobacter tropicalis NBRC 101654]|uniref:Uncharacterized protein n=1 Tax=Acetobacter tropicalis NBRC 101654 TaxID=749388 RepID=F7VEP7_9PROT|nr:hypothetical protein ATPR_1846 [Acetobacter tropicalis NBRC 101654]
MPNQWQHLHLSARITSALLCANGAPGIAFYSSTGVGLKNCLRVITLHAVTHQRRRVT